MSEKTLSIFIDESGDFGSYTQHSPYYLVTLILHNQNTDISQNILALETHLNNLGYPQHAIHTGPLIRRESVYTSESREKRKKLFNILFHFCRKSDFKYLYTLVKKSECPDVQSLTSRLTKRLLEVLSKHQIFFEQFDHIIIYYDNGQIELTKILTSVFHSLFTHVEFRKVQPANYKLFQAADLICTIELLAQKAENNSFSRSEQDFFGSIRDFKKNYLKPIQKKNL